MEKEACKIVWNKKAERQIGEIFDYIAEDSFQNAVKVVRAIEHQVSSLVSNPHKYPIDKQRKISSVNYRVFIKYSYKVSYFVGKDFIRIIRIRHTKMKPLKY